MGLVKNIQAVVRECAIDDADLLPDEAEQLAIRVDRVLQDAEWLMLSNGLMFGQSFGPTE